MVDNLWQATHSLLQEQTVVLVAEVVLMELQIKAQVQRVKETREVVGQVAVAE
jgi:hypothetical protein